MYAEWAKVKWLWIISKSTDHQITKKKASEIWAIYRLSVLMEHSRNIVQSIEFRHDKCHASELKQTAEFIYHLIVFVGNAMVIVLNLLPNLFPVLCLLIILY